MSQIDTVIFDLDGTLTRVPSPWRYIHERLGLWEGAARLSFEQWQSGRIGYEEFCRSDVALWKGRDIEELEALLAGIEMNPHVGPVVERLNASGVNAFIVSTGFLSVARRLQALFDWWSVEVRANDLIEGPDIRIHVSADARSPLSKKRFVESLMESGKSDPDRTLAISDSESDLEMMRICRHRLLVSRDDDLASVPDMIGPSERTRASRAQGMGPGR